VTQSGTTTTQRYAYDGWDPSKAAPVGNENWDVWADLSVVSGVQHLQTRYLRGDAVDQLFARVGYTWSGSSPTATPAWLLTDRLGSVREVTNGSGSVIDTITYDAWGNYTESTPGDLGRYGWTGREVDTSGADTDLQYNRGRYYDPTTARWLTQDPLGYDAGDSNLYRYVHNEPTGATDPSGKDIVILFDPTAKVPVIGTVGHPAVLIGNDKDGWRYFSFHAGDPNTTDDNLQQKFFKTLDDAKLDAALQSYADFIRYKTTKSQDDNGITEAESWDKKGYDLATRNCALLAHWVMKQAGVRIPTYRPGQKPNSWWPSVVSDAKNNAAVVGAGKWSKELPPNLPITPPPSSRPPLSGGWEEFTMPGTLPMPSSPWWWPF